MLSISSGQRMKNSLERLLPLQNISSLAHGVNSLTRRAAAMTNVNVEKSYAVVTHRL